MIRTYEELEALPRDTPIRDVFSVVWERADLAAHYAEEYGDYTVLPAVRLIPATISRDEFRRAYFAARESYAERTGVLGGVSQEDLTAALKVLGVEVE